MCPYACLAFGFVYMYMEFAFRKNSLKQTWSSGYEQLEGRLLCSFAVYWLNNRISGCHVLAKVNVLNKMKCYI